MDPDTNRQLDPTMAYIAIALATILGLLVTTAYGARPAEKASEGHIASPQSKFPDVAVVQALK